MRAVDERRVVVADHGHVLGHRQAGPADRADRAERLRVAGADDAGEAVGDEPAGDRLAPFEREERVLDGVVGKGEPGRGRRGGGGGGVAAGGGGGPRGASPAADAAAVKAASLRREGMWSSGPSTSPMRSWPRESRCPNAWSTATMSSVETRGKVSSSTAALTSTTGSRRSNSRW